MDCSIRVFNGKRPKLGVEVYVDATARVVGDVEIGDNSAIWYGSLVKGEVKPTRIGSETVIMEQCLVEDSRLEDRVLVSHKAVLHRCFIEKQTLIGIGAIVLDEACIRRGCIVGAGCLVTSGSRIAEGSIIVGSPARILREVTDKDRENFQRALQEALRKSRFYIEAMSSEQSEVKSR